MGLYIMTALVACGFVLFFAYFYRKRVLERSLADSGYDINSTKGQGGTCEAESTQNYIHQIDSDASDITLGLHGLVGLDELANFRIPAGEIQIGKLLAPGIGVIKRPSLSKFQLYKATFCKKAVVMKTFVLKSASKSDKNLHTSDQDQHKQVCIYVLHQTLHTTICLFDSCDSVYRSKILSILYFSIRVWTIQKLLRLLE